MIKVMIKFDGFTVFGHADRVEGDEHFNMLCCAVSTLSGAVGNELQRMGYDLLHEHGFLMVSNVSENYLIEFFARSMEDLQEAHGRMEIIYV